MSKTPLRELQEIMEWEGGLGGLLDYTDDIDEYDVSEETAAKFKQLSKLFDEVREQLERE